VMVLGCCRGACHVCRRPLLIGVPVLHALLAAATQLDFWLLNITAVAAAVPRLTLTSWTTTTTCPYSLTASARRATPTGSWPSRAWRTCWQQVRQWTNMTRLAESLLAVVGLHAVHGTAYQHTTCMTGSDFAALHGLTF
jgi:hypothetical protein